MRSFWTVAQEPAVGPMCGMIRTMATQTRVLVTDDLDGTEGARTYRFAWGDTRYEIDLTDGHRDDLLRALEPYITAARRTSAPRRARPTTD